MTPKRAGGRNGVGPNGSELDRFKVRVKLRVSSADRVEGPRRPFLLVGGHVVLDQRKNFIDKIDQAWARFKSDRLASGDSIALLLMIQKLVASLRIQIAEEVSDSEQELDMNWLTEKTDEEILEDFYSRHPSLRAIHEEAKVDPRFFEDPDWPSKEGFGI